MSRTQSPTAATNCAAMYVRMSTEHQQYSIANQSEAIELYAKDHSLAIVKTFVDSGKSGLTLTGRPALRQMLLEVISGSAGFEHILVYDVSRWGRFQDADEAAYYEYTCRKASVRLHYCMEQFTNDNSAHASLIKAIKRAMAGEYSRELSVKTFQGATRLALMGYRQGGSSGYGLRRLVVHAEGNARGVLLPGERKTLQSDRVVLIPGPAGETSVIRQIFKLFVTEDKSEQGIADLLNQRKVRPESNPHFPNPRWTRNRIHQILTNPKYVGTNVYNRKSTRSTKRQLMNPQEQWVRKEGAFKSVIPVDLYIQAQKIVSFRHEMTDYKILEHPRSLLKRIGEANGEIINNDIATPSAITVIRHFGSLVAAYGLIGYEAEQDCKRKGKELQTCESLWHSISIG